MSEDKKLELTLADSEFGSRDGGTTWELDQRWILAPGAVIIARVAWDKGALGLSEARAAALNAETGMESDVNVEAYASRWYDELQGMDMESFHHTGGPAPMIELAKGLAERVANIIETQMRVANNRW